MKNAEASEEKARLYLALKAIPHGRLCSYGRLAELAGFPGRARWVGRTLSQLPKDTSLPWFRVVNSAGKISFPKDSPGYQRQLEKLIEEGSAEESGRLFWSLCKWPE
ncbi:MGMT family protein [Spongiibacter sp. KMU-158]|uniref:MGMT family protein n=1 Tax=Spongiibacter pelagi TaxID=2760804 RepID=A0A927BZX4_9GAMM|nr:MGMT family protein [Spongiibacter pelagi]